MMAKNISSNGHHRREIPLQAPTQDDVIAEIEGASATLRSTARTVVGVTGDDNIRLSTLPSALSKGAGWYLVSALTAFVAIDAALAFILSAIGPEIRGALSLSRGTYTLIVAQQGSAAVLGSLGMAYAISRQPNQRVFLIKQAAFATGLAATLSAFTTSWVSLLLAVGLAGPAAGVVWAAHRPILMDGYLPEVRARVLSIHSAGVSIGAIVGVALFTVLGGAAGLSWRGILLVAGVTFLAAGFLGLRVRDLGVGRFDADRVRALVDTQDEVAPQARSHLTFVEALRRLWLIPTVRRLLSAWAVLGVVITPLITYMSFLLQDRWNMSVGERAAFFALASALAIPAVLVVGRRGDAAFRRDPARVIALGTVVMLTLAGGLIIGGCSPFVWLALAGFSLTFAASAIMIALLSVVTHSVVRPELRSHVGALTAVFLVAAGGEGGALLLGSLDRRFGPAAAVVLLSVPAVIAALVLRTAARTVNADLEATLGEIIEDQEARILVQRGAQPPLLACRNIDFSYGLLQVLFDVDFTVNDGEMLALLGTNGAGKSTLLKVVSGIGLPEKGSVRYRGDDITYLDAERRVPLGITQIPGGRAVFGPMDVVENLRSFGYTLGRDRVRIEEAIELCFEAFPRLKERRASLAANLSGGEQQMVGLCKALILRPRLLLIDELSLGLAPIIVGQLLDMVRRINQTGTAVVLVEQSVNVALSLVDHAYFMERGQMRFDGPAEQLLERDDLLRAVFLQGASKVSP